MMRSSVREQCSQRVLDHRSIIHLPAQNRTQISRHRCMHVNWRLCCIHVPHRNTGSQATQTSLSIKTPPLSFSTQVWSSWRASGRKASRIRVQAKPSKLSPVESEGLPRKLLEKEAHKVFDEAVITVKAGDGGNGEIVEAGRGKTVRNFKYKPGGNSPKKIFLSASEPSDGADGADVVLVCDPSYDNLLHLHQKKLYTASKGAHGNPAVGSAGPKNNATIRKARTPPLMIPVPPGTVVKRKGNGQALGELINPGDQLKVATGGRGGKGVKAPSREARMNRKRSELQRAAAAGAEIIEVEDVNWKEDAKGLPGQQLSLQLLLRVVADVGIVGFPNAGKSSLLRMLTRASPEVAPYPFTTLMPNLGVMTAGAGDNQPVLADLPGLIEGAHTGRGLGRMFLRHLRRTRVLLHVVDGAAADPATDYWVVREELRMFNPEFCARPHVVALNKVDLEDAGALQSELIEAIRAAAEDHHNQHRDTIPAPRPPCSIIPVSALTGQGLDQLRAALTAAVRGLPFKDVLEEMSEPNPRVAVQLGTAVATALTAAHIANGVKHTSGGKDLENDKHAASDEDSDDYEGDEDLFYEEDEELYYEGEEVGISMGSAGGVADENCDDEDVVDDKAPDDDEDLWLLNVSEEELLKMEKEYEEE